MGTSRARRLKSNDHNLQECKSLFLLIVTISRLEYMAFKVGRSESSIFYIRAHEGFFNKFGVDLMIKASCLDDFLS